MTDKTLDCSDIDDFLGKPIQPGRTREPIAGNDIRRWVQAMHYPNRLHYDDGFAAEGRYSRIVAPLSFPVACDDGHGTAPACVGLIPNSHLVFGGDDWWFHGPRNFDGDRITNVSIPLDRKSVVQSQRVSLLVYFRLHRICQKQKHPLDSK